MEVGSRSQAEEFLQFLDFCKKILHDTRTLYSNDPVFQRALDGTHAFKKMKEVMGELSAFTDSPDSPKNGIFSGIQQR